MYLEKKILKSFLKKIRNWR